MQYIILWHDDSGKLAEVVNKYIAAGWEPQGGIAVQRQEYAVYFYQAMIRR